MHLLRVRRQLVVASSLLNSRRQLTSTSTGAGQVMISAGSSTSQAESNDTWSSSRTFIHLRLTKNTHILEQPAYYHPFAHPPTYPPILSVRLSNHPSIHPSIHPFVRPLPSSLGLQPRSVASSVSFVAPRERADVDGESSRGRGGDAGGGGGKERSGGSNTGRK